LRSSGLHDLGNALDRPVGELCGVIAANFRGAALGTVRPCLCVPKTSSVLIA
jgi:hypothetical protein